jgi:hypothetical protein
MVLKPGVPVSARAIFRRLAGVAGTV